MFTRCVYRASLGVFALAALAALAALGEPVRASITISVDLLDAGDVGGPPPPGLLVADVRVDLSADDFFVAAGITSYTLHGATFVYAADPNARMFPPGIDEPFVTFGSVAYGRNDAARLAPAGTVAEQTIIRAMGYEPGSPTFSAERLNLAYAASPPADFGHPDAPFDRDGYVLRVVLDIGSIDLPGGQDVANYRIFDPQSVPQGYEPVFLSDAVNAPFGTAVGSIREQNISTGLDWGIYVPEPGMATLFIVGFLTLRLMWRRVGGTTCGGSRR